MLENIGTANHICVPFLQVEHLNEKVKIAEVGEDNIVTTSWAVNQLEGTSNFKTNVFFQWISICKICG